MSKNTQKKSYEEIYGKEVAIAKKEKMSKSMMGKNSKRMKELWEDPEYRQRMSDKQKGKKLSEEHKQKLREAMLGFKHSEETKEKMRKPKNKISSLKGKTYEDIHDFEKAIILKRNLSLMKTGLKLSIQSNKKGKTYEEMYGEHKSFLLKQLCRAPCGELHYNWKGGKSFEKYPKEFNKELKCIIKEKYNNRCILCNDNVLLHVHHIDYNKRNCEENNLICLCVSCHGKTNWNRRKWTNILNCLVEK